MTVKTCLHPKNQTLDLECGFNKLSFNPPVLYCLNILLLDRPLNSVVKRFYNFVTLLARTSSTKLTFPTDVI